MAYRNTSFHPIVDAENEYLREILKDARFVLRDPNMTPEEKLRELKLIFNLERL